MRGRILKSTLVVPLAVVMAVMLPGTALASPLQAATASAFGLSLSVLDNELVSPTPSQSAGPAPGSGSDNLITVPLETLVNTGVAGAKAQTTVEATITSEMAAGILRTTQGSDTVPGAFNAQGYARVDGLVVLTDQIPGLVDAVAQLLPTSPTALVAADVIHSEAVAACVDGQAVIAAGSQLVAAQVLGTDLTDLLDGTTNQVVDLGGTVLELLGGELIANQMIPRTNGVEVNALRLTLPLLGLDLTVAHSEVTGVVCGPVAPPDEEEILPRTGGDAAGMGLAVLAAGGLMVLVGRKLRHTGVS